MKAAGKLQAAMDLGSYDERFDATHDAGQRLPTESYELRSKLFDLGKDVCWRAPRRLWPAGGLGAFMKDFFIGTEPIMPGVDNVHARDMFPVQMHMAADARGGWSGRSVLA